MGDSFQYQRLRSQIETLGRHRARIDALLHKAVDALDDHRGHAPDVAVEVSLLLFMSEPQARRLVDLSATLVRRLPNTLAAMEEGRLDSYRASKVADVTVALSNTQAREVDQVIAPKVEGKGPQQVRRVAQYWATKIDPEAAARRAEHLRSERKIQLLHGEDGMSTLCADLPVAVASAAYARVDQLARALRTADEPRNLDQLRADVLADLLLGRTTTHSGMKADIHVYVDLTTLAGLNDDPAQLAGHGPVPASVAREIAHDANSTWQRIVTDPLTGTPVDVGRQRYRPPAVTDEFVRVRDRECRFPHCHRPAHFGDNDHHQAWQHEGSTNPSNLVNYCRRHHRLKNRPGWVYHLHPDTGAVTVTTPSGATYTSHPEPLHDPPPF
ncbi:DUF222 domain-containing protein [Saccharomonospora sp. NPDC046836]|uniref:HNH endonuclease signature motif containing protein n=1 Tax=Saccharomonospora sp. NPDC046836 TaxID=3156921 RepID=UPI0033D502B5